MVGLVITLPVYRINALDAFLGSMPSAGQAGKTSGTALRGDAGRLPAGRLRHPASARRLPQDA
jgi:hypothetical protein